MTGGGGGGGGFASDDDLLGSYGVGYGYYFTVNTDIDVPAVYSNSNGGVSVFECRASLTAIAVHPFVHFQKASHFASKS